MTIHVYHPYRQPDGVNHCQAVNGHCSHLCLPAPRINEHSPRITCACPTGLKLMADGLMCVEDSKYPIPPVSLTLFPLLRAHLTLSWGGGKCWLLVVFGARISLYSSQVLPSVRSVFFY